MKKNILFISPFSAPNIGGVETHIRLLREYLVMHGCAVTLLTYQPLTTKLKAPGQEHGSEQKTYRFSWIGHNLFTKLENYPAVLNFIYLTPYLTLRSILFMMRHYKEFDIIHVFGMNAAFVGRILKMIFKKPVVMSTKGIYEFNSQSISATIMRWVVGGMDTIMVGSLDSKDDFINLGIESEKLTVFTHWIDHAQFKPTNKQQSKRQLKWKDQFTCIYVGRLISQKGIELILQTAKDMPHVQFKLVGEGTLIEAVEIADQKHANVEFLGRADTNKVSEYLSGADVFLYPILYHEDVSLAILESLASGTPVISSYQGSGVYRMINNGALIVEPDVAQIKQAIERAQDPQTHAHLVTQAEKFAEEFKESAGKIFIDIYNRLT